MNLVLLICKYHPSYYILFLELTIKRDCELFNLMMDADALYPHGFHPVQDLFLPDGVTPAMQLSRIGVPIRYYFIDFGLSVHIPKDVYPKLAVGAYGRDQEVPELSWDVPYDPFKVDIFILGNNLKKAFYNVCHLHSTLTPSNISIFTRNSLTLTSYCL